jgi:hypothetical protein
VAAASARSPRSHRVSTNITVEKQAPRGPTANPVNVSQRHRVTPLLHSAEDNPAVVTSSPSAEDKPTSADVSNTLDSAELRTSTLGPLQNVHQHAETVDIRSTSSSRIRIVVAVSKTVVDGSWWFGRWRSWDEE